MVLIGRASSMEIQQKHIPQLRFPDFLNNGEWKVKRLGEIAEKVTSKNKSNKQLPVLTNSATEGVVNQKDYFDREIVTKDNLANYHIIELNNFVYNPRISVAAPVGPISRNKIGTGIMSPLYTIFKFKEGNIDFFEQYFRTNCWHQYLKDKANFGARFDRMNISNEDFFNLPIPFPPLSEQRRIAQALTALDELIAATNERLEQMKAYKKGLMQQLFVDSMGGGKSLKINYLQIPKLRFPEFYEEKEWEEKKLGEIFMRITDRNKENNQNVLTISAQYGLVSQYDYFNKNVASTDVSNYYIINKGDFAYNKSRSQGHPYGAIKSLRLYDKGIVSPLYICFRTKSDDFDCDFLEYYFDTDLIDGEIGQIAQEGARNHGLLNISTTDFFDNVTIFVPPLPEQRKIASCLSAMDETINAYTEKVGLLGQYKKGLMQQMFVN